MKRHVSVLAVTACAAATMVSAPVAAAGADPAPATTAGPAASALPARNFLRLWMAEWMIRGGGPYSPAQLQTIAKRFDLIVTMPEKFTADVATMKAANPALRLAVYRNATFATGTQPEAMYAHDAQGNRIHSIKWPTTFLMELGSSAWQQKVAATCSTMVAKSHYDDCYLDVLGNGPLIAGDYMNAVPVHPATKQPWTANEWIGWTVDISDAVAAGVGRRAFGNGLGTGIRYFDPALASRPLVAANRQVAAEGFARNAYGDINTYLPEADWQKDVDMIADAEAQGKGLLTITKIWVPATEAQQNAWHEYTLASFLLGSGGKSRFFFMRDDQPGAQLMDHPYNRIDPGTPTGAYRKQNGIYRRDFTHSLVLVNPTATTRWVRLNRTYTTLDGATVKGSVKLVPNAARILRF